MLGYYSDRISKTIAVIDSDVFNKSECIIITNEFGTNKRPTSELKYLGNSFKDLKIHLDTMFSTINHVIGYISNGIDHFQHVGSDYTMDLTIGEDIITLSYKNNEGYSYDEYYSIHDLCDVIYLYRIKMNTVNAKYGLTRIHDDDSFPKQVSSDFKITFEKLGLNYLKIPLLEKDFPIMELINKYDCKRIWDRYKIPSHFGICVYYYLLLNKEELSITSTCNHIFYHVVVYYKEVMQKLGLPIN